MAPAAARAEGSGGADVGASGRHCSGEPALAVETGAGPVLIGRPGPPPEWAGTAALLSARLTGFLLPLRSVPRDGSRCRCGSGWRGRMTRQHISSGFMHFRLLHHAARHGLRGGCREQAFGRHSCGPRPFPSSHAAVRGDEEAFHLRGASSASVAWGGLIRHSRGEEAARTVRGDHGDTAAGRPGAGTGR